MTDATDMSTPVTRGELRQELELFKQEFATKQELQDAVAQLATKQELQDAVAQLATKQELQDAVAQLATKQELAMWGGALLAHIKDAEQRLQADLARLQADLARHANAIMESLLTPISAIDEKYKDLPGRVSQLESKVFAPERR